MAVIGLLVLIISSLSMWVNVIDFFYAISSRTISGLTDKYRKLALRLSDSFKSFFSSCLIE